MIESIMKRDVYFVPAEATVGEAVKLFVEKGISAAPVVNDAGEAVAFISDGDVMRALSKRDKTYMDPIVMIMRTDQKLDALMSLNVRSLASDGIIGVDVHADLPEVCRVLGENHLKKVPVLDSGHVVGMINRSDITQYAMKSYLEKHT